MIVCQWFLLCTLPADRLIHHPVLSYVPTCQHCADKLGLGDGVALDATNYVDGQTVPCWSPDDDVTTIT